jgi:hypothetical protein
MKNPALVRSNSLKRASSMAFPVAKDKRNGHSAGMIGVLICAFVLSSGAWLTPSCHAAPDLIVRSMVIRGPVRLDVNRGLVVPLRIVIANINSDPAFAFLTEVYVKVSGGSFTRGDFRLDGSERPSSLPRHGGLLGRRQIELDGEIAINSPLPCGATIELQAMVDDTRGRGPNGDVVESNEANNRSSVLSVPLENAVITSLSGTIRTGGDNLRGQNDNTFILATLSGDRATEELFFNNGQELKAHTSREQSISLPAGTTLCDVQNLIVRATLSPGWWGVGHDDWHIQSITVRAQTPAGPRKIAETRGGPRSPFAVLKSSQSQVSVNLQ